MKRLLKLFSFFFAFNMEVRVHAEMVFSPENCWAKSSHCGAENSSAKPEALKISEGKVTLSAQTIVSQRPQNYRLVRGKVLVSAERLEWSSLFANFKCVEKCLFILEKEDGYVRALALRGNLQVNRLGDLQTYNLPEGFWVRVGAVGPEGSAPMEFPQSLAVQPTLKEWAELYQGELHDFKKESRNLMPIWTNAAVVASQWQKSVAERNLAAYEAEQTKAQKARAAREMEDQRLRKIFLERNFLNQ